MQDAERGATIAEIMMMINQIDADIQNDAVKSDLPEPLFRTFKEWGRRIFLSNRSPR